MATLCVAGGNGKRLKTGSPTDGSVCAMEYYYGEEGGSGTGCTMDTPQKHAEGAQPDTRAVWRESTERRDLTQGDA